MNFSLKAFLAFLFVLFFSVCVLNAQNSSGTSGYETDEASISLNFSQDDMTSVSSGTSAASSFWIFFRMIIVLAFVLFIVWFVFKLMKKSIEPGVQNDLFLRKVSSITIAPGKTVQIVTLNEHSAYVLGVSDDSVSLIDKVEDKELINALNVEADKRDSVSRPKNFSDLLDVFSGTRKAFEEISGGKKKGLYGVSTGSILDSLKNKKVTEGEDHENEE